MKFSYHWIQQHIAQKLPAPEDIAQQIIFHAFEVESSETVGDDIVLDIKVLPDRAGDCLSHRGMAREVAGLLQLTLKEQSSPALPSSATEVPVEVKSDACRTYLAVRIDGIQVAPSPAWLTEALGAIGQKSINTVVDATNFVLHDSGQPVHVFDAAKVDGGIVVRLAKGGETITVLGGEEKTLTDSDLVIADYLGALAIAGVKGGVTAEVTEATTSIIVEVANFDPIAVRKTSRRLGLITDASKRFENNLSVAAAVPAMQQVVALILELAGGTVSAVTQKGITSVVPRTISFSHADITRLLGPSISEAQIDAVLDRYHYQYTKTYDAYMLTVPFYRADLIGAHDIAEEVGRVIGYDTIPSAPLPFAPTVEPNAIDLQLAAARAWALANGYREIYTYTFRAKGEVAVAYGAKGKDKLRSNLSDGLKESYELNRLNAPLLGLTAVKLFEMGTVFFADKEEMHVALCDKGTIQELPLAAFLAEKGIDAAGATLPSVALSAPAPFIPWSSYPFITRDIALWVDSAEAEHSVHDVIHGFAASACAQPPQLFDRFEKDGRTSVAYRCIFQAPDRTLTDEEVAASFAMVTEQLKGITGVELR